MKTGSTDERSAQLLRARFSSGQERKFVPLLSKSFNRISPNRVIEQSYWMLELGSLLLFEGSCTILANVVRDEHNCSSTPLSSLEPWSSCLGAEADWTMHLPLRRGEIRAEEFEQIEFHEILSGRTQYNQMMIHAVLYSAWWARISPSLLNIHCGSFIFLD